MTSFLPRTRSTTELGGQRVNTLPEDYSAEMQSALWDKLLSKQGKRAGLFCFNKGVGSTFKTGSRFGARRNPLRASSTSTCAGWAFRTARGRTTST